MSWAAVALLGLIFGLLFFDWATLRNRGRRMLLLETAAFGIGALLVIFPDTATRLAHLVGIGRGVDFVIYPLVIWLVRESLMNRHRRWEDSERLTHVVRMMAIESARHSMNRSVPHCEADSPSRTP